MTQAQINDAVNTIVNQYTGQSVGYQDSYFGQCTVPVCYYVDLLTGETRAPSMANDRADGWGVQFPSSLSPFFTHEHFQSGKIYPVGTILMWNSPHIAIVLHSDGSNVAQVFEQNADPDGAPCKTASRVINNAYHMCTYALVPIITAAIPPPPVNPVLSYEAVTPSHDMRTSKQPTEWWNLNNTTTDISTFHPAAQLDLHQEFTIGGLIHHINSYTYAMTPDDYTRFLNGDRSTFNGVNTLDLEEIPPPPPPVIPPAPPQGALHVPVATSTITLQNPVATFISATDALNHTNAKTTISYGKYTLYDTSLDGMLYINKNLGDPKVWINPADDVAPKPIEEDVPISQPAPQPVTPPVVPLAPQVSPTQWRESYKPFHLNAPLIPVKYVSIQDFVLRDLGSQRPDMYIPEDKEFGLYGTFTGPDGKEYLRAKTNGDAAFQYWYGVPMQHPEGGIGYVVTAGILEIFPKPIQHGYIYGVATVEKAIDIVLHKFTKRKVKK